MNTFAKGLGIAVLSSLAVAGCTGTKANMAADGTAAANSAGAAGASTMGMSDSLVQVAVQAAKGWMSNKLGTTQGAVATADDKAAAAQAGVDAATAKAKQDGTTVTDDQKTGLLTMLKGML